MKKTQTKGVSTRAAITDVAVRLFSERGYTGTTMRDIAEAVGVLPGSLYAHIESKETLLLEIVSHGIAQFLAIEKTLEGSRESAELLLRKAIRGHIEVVVKDPERSLVVFHQWRFLSEPNLASAIAMRRRYANGFMKIIDAGKAEGVFSPRLDTRIAVFGILGALNWIPEWYSADGPSDSGQIAEQLAAALLYGLRDGSAWDEAVDAQVSLPPAVKAAKKKASRSKSAA